MKPHLVLILTVALNTASGLAGPIETRDKKIPRQDETALQASVDFGVGSIDLHRGTPELILDATLKYDRKYVDVLIDYTLHGGEGLLDVSSDLDADGNVGKVTNEWDIGLSGDIPLDLALEIGAAEARIDLTDLQVTHLDLEVGAADAEVWWDRPNRGDLTEIAIECGASSFRMTGLGNAHFEHLQFEGGVGSFELDFSGDWTRSARADLEIGLGSLDIVLPEGIGVRIESEDSFLSSVDVDRNFERVGDGVYETPGYASAAVKLDIGITLGMGSVDVRMSNR